MLSALRMRRASVLALSGLTMLALALPGSASAAPPTEQDFRVLYYITDEDGERGRQMSQQDMQLFVNKARCECNQQIITRITYQGSGVDAEQIRAMVGQQCAEAQQSPGIGTYKLCAQVGAGLPQAFQTSPEYSFEPIWLASGVAGGDQTITGATPFYSCEDNLVGEGGLWMCAGVENCTMGNFFMSGTWNANLPDGEPSTGIQFDFQAPVSPPSNFSVSPGDSSVQISWENLAPGDIAGYRVLCADEEGNPVDNGVSFSAPTATSIVNGTIYYTAQNLCPDGAFGEEEGDGDGDGDGDTGDGDGDGDSETDTGTEDTGTEDTGTEDTGTETGGEGCMSGTEGCVCAEGDICDAGLECNGSFCVAPTSGIMTLDYAYVCSDHLGFNTSSTRISGLENGKTYTFLVVAYDKAGNPVFGETVQARPVPTNGLWEQCEANPGVCGEGWTCSVTDQPRNLGWLFGVLSLAGLGGAVALRRRRRA